MKYSHKKIKIPIYFGFLHIVFAKDFVRACKSLKINKEGHEDIRLWADEGWGVILPLPDDNLEINFKN